MQVLRSGRHTIHSRKLKNRGGQVADNYDQYSKEELLHLLRERDRKPQFGRKDNGRFMTIRQNANGKNAPDQIVQLDLMVEF